MRPPETKHTSREHPGASHLPPQPKRRRSQAADSKTKGHQVFSIPVEESESSIIELNWLLWTKGTLFLWTIYSTESMCVNVRNSLWQNSECQSLVTFPQNWNPRSDGLKKKEGKKEGKKKSIPFEMLTFPLKTRWVSFAWPINFCWLLEIWVDLDPREKGPISRAGSPLPSMQRSSLHIAFCPANVLNHSCL